MNLPDRTYGADDCDEVSSTRPEGLVDTYRISEPRAAEIYDIIRLNTCRLLTTDAPMPMIWPPENLVSNLPELMVTTVRRFYYKSIGRPVPSDLSFIKQSIHMTHFSGF